MENAEQIKNSTPTRELFKNIIGQTSAKRRLSFYLDGYMKDKIMRNILLVSAKGCGKSLFAKEIARGLVKFNENGEVMINEESKLPMRKNWLEVNCSIIKSVKQFISEIIIPHVVDKDVCLFLDEASELPQDVTFSLLSMLNPNESNRNTFIYNDYTCEIDFKKQTFLFATSESDKIQSALSNRLSRIDLEPYNNSDLINIIKKHTPSVEYEDGVLEDVASVLRGNARSAVIFSKDIMTYLKDCKACLRKDWEELKKILGIYPLGLRTTEITLLKFLADRPMGTSLTSLAAKLGMNTDVLRKDIELQLQAYNLMDIQAGKGRVLTVKGYEYLRGLPNLCL